MKPLFFYFILLFVPVAVLAQPLRLQDAVNIALKNSLDIQLVKNNQQIADVNNYIGVAGGLPLVTSTASDNESSSNVNQKINTTTGIQNIQRSGASSNSLSAGVTGSILLYNGLRVVATK